MTRFSTKYDFEKPNDKRALDLMNAAARAVMTELPDTSIAYGVSDEYRYMPPPPVVKRPWSVRLTHLPRRPASFSTKHAPFSNVDQGMFEPPTLTYILVLTFPQVSWYPQ